MSLLVLMEQRGGAWNRMSFETLAAAQEFGAKLGLPVAAAVPGHGVEALAGELAGYRLERVWAVEHELLRDYTPDGYALALRQLIEHSGARLVVSPHTYQARDFLPKLATVMNRVAVSDAIAFRVEDGRPLLVRQLYQGKLNADVRFLGDPPWFASLQASAPWTWPPRNSSFPWAAASARRTTSRWSSSSPMRWARNWPPPAPSATPAGSPWSGRWAAPARPWRPSCTWPSASPAPSSTWWG